jgi:hypothetical protein
MKISKTLIASCLVAGSTLAMAEIEWLEPRAGDLLASSLTTELRAVPSSMHHESAPINFSWNADQATAGRTPAAGPSETPTTPVVESRQYWLDVTGADLARGVELPLTAPGAVVRISALESGSGISLDPDRLQLEIDGRPVNAELGPQDFTTGAEMRREGMQVPEDSLAFRLSDRVGGDSLRITHEGLRDQVPLVINVFEPNSAWTARLALPRFNVLAGQPLDFEFSLGNGREQIEAASMQAVLVSPDASQTWPIAARDGNGLAMAAAPLADTDRPVPGLYETHVYVEGEFRGQTIRRDLTLAFNIAPATARFSGTAERNRASDLALVMGIENVVAGRYQVNAEILGTNARGQLELLGFVQSAAELEAGGGQIELALDDEMVRASGLSAPFEVRNLQLLDQGRMYLLEDREQALRLMH